MKIHPTAIVDSSAQIGADVEIGPYCVIGPRVKIGHRCRFLSHAVIEHTEMGSDCVVYPYASLGLPPQHFGYKGEPTLARIGNRCTIREGVTLHRGTALDKSLTSIGDDCYFMGYSHIAHDCVIGNSVVLANGVLLAGHVQVGDRAFMSGSAAVHQFVRIGRNAMISGGAMVPADVIPYAVAQGDRARLFGINVVGLRRAGADRATIKLIKEAFRTIFFSKQTIKECLMSPVLNVDNSYVAAIKDFISSPKRGFIRPAARSFEKMSAGSE